MARLVVDFFVAFCHMLGIKILPDSDWGVTIIGAFLIFGLMFLFSVNLLDRMSRKLFGDIPGKTQAEETLENPEAPKPAPGKLSCFFVLVVIAGEFYVSLLIASHLMN